MWQESLSELAPVVDINKLLSDNKDWGMSQVSQTSHQPQSWQKQGKNQEARHQKGVTTSRLHLPDMETVILVE
jgi:hypothetical protein